LDDEQRLPPRADPTGQEDKERAISRCAARALDTPPQDEELLPQQCILGHEGRLTPREVGERPREDDRGGWLRRRYEAVLEALREVLTETGDPMVDVSQHRSTPWRVWIVKRAW